MAKSGATVTLLVTNVDEKKRTTMKQACPYPLIMHESVKKSICRSAESNVGAVEESMHSDMKTMCSMCQMSQGQHIEQMVIESYE